MQKKKILSNLTNNAINWDITISNLWGQSNEKVLQLIERLLREKCPNMELFLVRISYIQTEYGDVLNTENTEFYISKAVWFVKEHIQKFGKSRDVQYVK